MCARKVRVVPDEQGLDYREHLMILQGDQCALDYTKPNPNGVGPALAYGVRPVIELAVIPYYLDKAFLNRALIPADPQER